jgi:hypothetical protein
VSPKRPRGSWHKTHTGLSILFAIFFYAPDATVSVPETLG